MIGDGTCFEHTILHKRETIPMHRGFEQLALQPFKKRELVKRLIRVTAPGAVILRGESLIRIAAIPIKLLFPIAAIKTRIDRPWCNYSQTDKR